MISTQAHGLAALLLRDVPMQQRENMGLFIGTRYGCLEDDRIFQQSRREDGGKFASPAAFRRTLPSTLPAELSIAFGIRGPLITYAESDAPAMIAIIRAYHWIATGRISTAVAGSFDFLLTGPSNCSAAPICRTVLCLMAARGTFHDLNIWAEITHAAIETNIPSMDQTAARTDETDFTTIFSAITATNRSPVNVTQASRHGQRCTLKLAQI